MEAELPFWTCKFCSSNNEVKVKTCGGCKNDKLSESQRLDNPRPQLLFSRPKVEEPPAKQAFGADENNHLMKGFFGEYNPKVQNNAIKAGEQGKSPSMDQQPYFNCSKINCFEGAECENCQKSKNLKVHLNI